MISFPTEWVETPLDNIADWGSGGTPSRKNEDYYGGDIPWFKTGDLGERIIKKPSEYITELGLKNSSAKIFPKGAVAIAMYGATIGKVSILGIDATTNQACAVGNPKPNVTTSEFLYYFLLNEKDVFVAKGKGGAQPNISQGLIKEHVVYLPPVAEQKEIVDRLDILLAQVEATQARLARIPYIIKQFRQSVLAAAVSGKLTEEWRIKHANTPWLDGVLGDFINKPTYGSSAKSDKDGLVPVLRMGNLQNGKLDWTELVYTSDEVEIEKFKLKTGDVLFNRTNSPELVGKTSIYRGERTAIYAGYLIKISCLPVLNPEFLNYHLNSPSARAYCYAVKSDGVSQSNINAKKLAEYPMLLPHPAEQTEIVRRVEQLFAYADTIEQQAKVAKAQVDKLTQAILAKAFRGELTADWRAANPDLINGDHSAEALLAKINSERQEMKLANKKADGKLKAKKNHQPKKNSDSAVINLINKKGIAKPQDIFNELKAYMVLRDVLKEISQLLDQNLIREVDIDGQKHLEINR
ncbi:restriction endonuclease subunit S [Aeromonas veronii]